ncbi:MFS transporter [Gallaecimonas sp. GXIMD1310]|uniref:MFS transporter n=1 Tax=Gallaecimonas sp. GXIMD1310 TaxID=3131926 RepID=UPI003255C05C
MSGSEHYRHIRWLTYLMFMAFAMTTDAVGVVIPQVTKEFGLSLTAAGAIHYAPMIAIALSGIGLGFMADRLGRKKTVITGLALFSLSSFLVLTTHSFLPFLGLLTVSGLAIGIFKTGALALIGDISPNSKVHTSTMNMVEGFFGVGAIIGPAIVSYLLSAGMPWDYLYAIAGVLCLGLCWLAYATGYPAFQPKKAGHTSLGQTFALLKDRHALGFSLAIAFYVATEVAIYVWMPSLLKEYRGHLVWLATYALTVFFVLRAAGRLLGGWLVRRVHWAVLMFSFSLAIFLCYLGTMIGGVSVAVFLLPLSGLFMAMMYPTLNSKGISCFERHHHGAVAGIILFFTAAAAALGPLLMGVVSDALGDIRYGFYLATGFAGALWLLMAINLLVRPADARLAAIEAGVDHG